MKTVNVQEAKTHLSRLLDRVEAGEDIMLARSGRPVALLTKPRLEPRQPGRLKGRIRIHDDFDDPLPPDLARAFGADE